MSIVLKNIILEIFRLYSTVSFSKIFPNDDDGEDNRMLILKMNLKVVCKMKLLTIYLDYW